MKKNPLTPPACSVCRRPLQEGQVAWAAEWKVVEKTGHVRTETRYTCDPCEEAKHRGLRR